jgi:hypothetical protein
MVLRIANKAAAAVLLSVNRAGFRRQEGTLEASGTPHQGGRLQTVLIKEWDCEKRNHSSHIDSKSEQENDQRAHLFALRVGSYPALFQPSEAGRIMVILVQPAKT